MEFWCGIPAAMRLTTRLLRKPSNRHRQPTTLTHTALEEIYRSPVLMSDPEHHQGLFLSWVPPFHSLALWRMLQINKRLRLQTTEKPLSKCHQSAQLCLITLNSKHPVQYHEGLLSGCVCISCNSYVRVCVTFLSSLLMMMLPYCISSFQLD